MVPAPRGAGIVAARVPKKVLQFAGIDDVFTSSRGSTKTLGNFVEADVKKQKLIEKFKELKESGKLESFMENKRKKNAAKDHRYVPYRRPTDQ